MSFWILGKNIKISQTIFQTFFKLKTIENSRKNQILVRIWIFLYLNVHSRSKKSDLRRAPYCIPFTAHIHVPILRITHKQLTDVSLQTSTHKSAQIKLIQSRNFERNFSPFNCVATLESSATQRSLKWKRPWRYSSLSSLLFPSSKAQPALAKAVLS